MSLGPDQGSEEGRGEERGEVESQKKNEVVAVPLNSTDEGLLRRRVNLGRLTGDLGG